MNDDLYGYEISPFTDLETGPKHFLKFPTSKLIQNRLGNQVGSDIAGKPAWPVSSRPGTRPSQGKQANWPGWFEQWNWPGRFGQGWRRLLPPFCFALWILLHQIFFGKSLYDPPEVSIVVYITPWTIKPGIVHIKLCKTGQITPWVVLKGGFGYVDFFLHNFVCSYSMWFSWQGHGWK